METVSEEDPALLERLKRKEQIARDSMERYSGSKISEFQDFLLLTNFPQYVESFAASRKVSMQEGSMFKVAHAPADRVSILDFKIGSPAAALVVDLCAFLPLKACLLLGMCGGLRRSYAVGDYFVPVAGIRGDGTSDFYFPPDVPAIANFVVQKAVATVLDEGDIPYHVGITHATNNRFWEFNEEFTKRLKATRAQAIEMECSTLFIASYKHKLPLGALLLISDLPLMEKGIKTKLSSQHVFDNYTEDHVRLGVTILHQVERDMARNVRGAHRGRVFHRHASH